MLVAGIDCGAETTKIVLWSTEKDKFQILPLLANKGNGVDALVRRALEEAAPGKIGFIVATGALGMKLEMANSRAPDSLCLARAAGRVAPEVHTIIDAGAGKVLVVKCKNGVPMGVSSSSRCAGGTGAYLEVAAEILGVPVTAMGALALRGKETVPVQSTCAVFAESEIISLIHSGKSREDIAKGVVVSCANRIYPLLGAVNWEKEVALVGGCAHNAALGKAIGEMINAEVTVPPDPEFYPAIGAAIVAREQAHE